MILLYHNRVRFLTRYFWLLSCIDVLLFLCNILFLEKPFGLDATLTLWISNTFLFWLRLCSNLLLKGKTCIFRYQNNKYLLDLPDIFGSTSCFSYCQMSCWTNKPIDIFIVIRFIFIFSTSLCYRWIKSCYYFNILFTCNF